MFSVELAERVGFEPTAPCGVTGFQDQLLKPLGHLSLPLCIHLLIHSELLYHTLFFFICQQFFYTLFFIFKAVFQQLD